jgi:RHS repeat-associated protein
VHDANYNVTALLNTSGTVVERYAYDPYGTPTYFDASYGTRLFSSYGWTHLNQGLRWDAGTGKVWNRWRDYDPAQGRLTVNDPKGFAAGDVNLYRYVGNGPTASLDPSGLEEDYRSNFWDRFSKSARDSDQFIPLRASCHVHHTKPKILKALYEHLGVNIHAAEHLRGVDKVVHQEFTNQQHQFIQSEMDRFGKGWKYANPADVQKFIDKVKNDPDFIKRLNAFTDNQTKLAEKAKILFKNCLSAREVGKQLDLLDGTAKRAKAALTVRGFGSKLFPKLANVLAVFSLLVPAQVVCAGHNAEQKLAFEEFWYRYESAYTRAAAGGNLERLDIQILQHYFLAYLKSLGFDDEAIAAADRMISNYLADK